MEKNKTVLIGAGRYLLHNTGVEVSVVSGALATQKEFEAAMMEFLKSKEYGLGDTMHILSIDKRGVDVTDFSGRFMDEMLERAGLSVEI